MNKLTAIKYLITNEINTSEWKESEMYRIIKETVNSEKKEFKEKELKNMLERVRRA